VSGRAVVARKGNVIYAAESLIYVHVGIMLKETKSKG